MNSIEHRLSSEAKSLKLFKKFLLLWNLKGHYRAQKNLPPVHILSQMHPAHTSPNPICLRSILILSSSVRLNIPNGLFPSSFLTKILYLFLSSNVCYMPFQSHPSFDHPINTWKRVKNYETSHYVIFSILLSLSVS
jgi:hypothetical protein